MKIQQQGANQWLHSLARTPDEILPEKKKKRKQAAQFWGKKSLDRWNQELVPECWEEKSLGKERTYHCKVFTCINKSESNLTNYKNVWLWSHYIFQ